MAKNNTPRLKKSDGPQAKRIGLVWIVVFYVTQGTDVTVPVMTKLDSWNLVIGMGFIVAAFGFAMKWE